MPRVKSHLSPLLCLPCLLLLLGCSSPEVAPPPPLPPGVDLEEMVLVPAGEFTMGAVGPGIPKAYGPVRRVRVGAFMIDRFAVTNLEYRLYLQATGAIPPPHWTRDRYPAGLDHHPVVNVSRDEAAAYAAWRGKRLPTEAEWEKAARGSEARIFQWGDSWDPARCNSGERDYFRKETVPVYAHLDVDSPYGCCQLTGNCWEWCADRVRRAPYPAQATDNPCGEPGGTWGVSRGGSWTTIWQGCRTFSRCISVNGGRYGYTGFRCVRDLLPPEQLEPPGREGMVEVPEGWFLRGTPPGDGVRPDETPQRRIWLRRFLIDRCAVTNREYRAFVLATGHRLPTHWRRGRYPAGLESHPVVNVSWEDAAAFARWAGKRLPTEAEWEKAARGSDGRRFPWGDEYDGDRCNGIDKRISNTVPVDSFPEGASPYGLLQMSGNCWEWVADWYSRDYYRECPDRNPTGPARGDRRILRGGTWSSTRYVLTTTARCRAHVGCHWSYTGFRCAAD